MPKMELVKTGDGRLRGYTSIDEERWQGWKRYVEGLGAGEFFELSYRKPRSTPFHKRFMKMLRVAFEHWDPERGRKRKTFKGRPIEKNFERFREDMLILAGFGIPTYEVGPSGRVRVKWEAKSIAYENMDQEEFERVYPAVYEVLLQEVMFNYTREDFDRTIAEFERFVPRD